MIVHVPIETLHPNTWNPNVVPDETKRALRENIDRAGFNQPILVRPHPQVDGHYEIVDGEHRWRAAKDRGDDAVPVVVRQFSEAEAKAQTIAMNRLRGEMEPADMARIVREIEEDGIGLADLARFSGLTSAELEGLAKLAAFDWQQFEDHKPPKTPVDPAADEDWINLRFRVPESIAALVRDELDRLKGIRGTEHEHLAFELMVVNSSQAPAEHMEGE